MLQSTYNDYLSPGFSDQKDSQDAVEDTKSEPPELNKEEEEDEEMLAEKDKKQVNLQTGHQILKLTWM